MMSFRWLRRRWNTLPWSDRLLVGEAVALLVVSTVVIKLVSFRQLGILAAWPRCDNAAPAERRLVICRRVRWAVLSVARSAPCSARCFQQGLTAQWMLRRRGVPSVFFYGAAMRPEQGLAAHVWIQDDNVAVIGGEIAHQYAVLATFPPLMSVPGSTEVIDGAAGSR